MQPKQFTEKEMAMVDTVMERDEQLQSLPLLGEKNDEKIILKDNIETDKPLTATFFHLLKVRQNIWCDVCGSPRAVCSMFAFFRNKGPTQDDKDTLEQHIEKGYMCGDSLYIPKYNL